MDCRQRSTSVVFSNLSRATRWRAEFGAMRAPGVVIVRLNFLLVGVLGNRPCSSLLGLGSCGIAITSSWWLHVRTY